MPVEQDIIDINKSPGDASSCDDFESDDGDPGRPSDLLTWRMHHEGTKKIDEKLLDARGRLLPPGETTEACEYP